jgi:hypothetical protein
MSHQCYSINMSLQGSHHQAGLDICRSTRTGNTYLEAIRVAIGYIDEELRLLPLFSQHQPLAHVVGTHPRPAVGARTLVEASNPVACSEGTLKSSEASCKQPIHIACDIKCYCRCGSGAMHGARARVGGPTITPCTHRGLHSV